MTAGISPFSFEKFMASVLMQARRRRRGPKTKTPPIRRGLRSKTVVSSRSLHATPPARHMTVMMAMDCVRQRHWGENYTDQLTGQRSQVRGNLGGSDVGRPSSPSITLLSSYL